MRIINWVLDLVPDRETSYSVLRQGFEVRDNEGPFRSGIVIGIKGRLEGVQFFLFYYQTRVCVSIRTLETVGFQPPV